jgi:hypothetical protein
MSKLGDGPAFPECDVEGDIRDGDGKITTYLRGGFTKREYAALILMAGIESDRLQSWREDAQHAFAAADAFLQVAEEESK